MAWWSVVVLLWVVAAVLLAFALGRAISLADQREPHLTADRDALPRRSAIPRPRGPFPRAARRSRRAP